MIKFEQIIQAVHSVLILILVLLILYSFHFHREAAQRDLEITNLLQLQNTVNKTTDEAFQAVRKAMDQIVNDVYFDGQDWRTMK